MPEQPAKGFNVFKVFDDVRFNRIGTRVQAQGRDGKFQESDSVEANLLYEILKQLKKGSK